MEQQYLEDVIAFARAQWEQAKASSEAREADIRAAQEELREDVSRRVMGLSSMQGFHDLVELSQSAQGVSDGGASQESDAQIMASLQSTMDSPYFARIDFHFDDEEEAERIYIGRATLMDRDALRMYVHDWRAPISSVFYRYGLGAARYDAPEGVISGKVLLKRQYEIRGGKIDYFFDADVQIVDEFLRKLLAKPTSAHMKTIVETIQRDQDVVIRDMDSDVLIVQGAAGSGKTSVALHRVAYLLYRGLRGRFSAEEILILSPSTVFERYIARVLPELGERSVRSALFEEIFQALLPDVRVQPRAAYWEECLSASDAERTLWQRAAAFKGSEVFVRMLDRLARDLPGSWLDFRDIDYAGQRIAWRDQSKSFVCNAKRTAPVGVRLRWLEHAILERAHALQAARHAKLKADVARFPAHAFELEAFARMLSIGQSAALLREIRAFTSIDCRVLYRRLFADRGAFYRLARGLPLPEEIEAIRQFTVERIADDDWAYDDACALSYLQARVHGCELYRNIRQVALDEAQDGDALHFALMRELFPHARFTLLGDVNQTIAKSADMALYEQATRALGKPKTTLMTLNKSFRCTQEIWAYSTRFLAGEPGECFSRNGDAPTVQGARDEAELCARLTAAVRDCQTEGHAAIGLLCKTEADAQRIHRLLSPALPLRLIVGDSIAELQGTCVIPIYLAKGLEFDAALVCDADAAHYHSEEDKRLLYVACTRALHRLSLFYVGAISPLLGGETV